MLISPFYCLLIKKSNGKAHLRQWNAFVERQRVAIVAIALGGSLAI